MMKFLNSFLSGIPISWYIISFLAVSLSGSLWVLQGKIEEIGGLKVAQESYVKALESSQKQLEMGDLSCKIDDADSVAVEQEKKELQSKVDNLTVQISKLKSGIKKPVSQNTNNLEAPKNAEANTILDGTELLSDDLVRMLTQSYCLVETTACVSP